MSWLLINLEENTFMKLLFITINIFLIFIMIIKQTRKFGYIFIFGIVIIYFFLSFYYPLILFITTPLFIILYIKIFRLSKKQYFDAKAVFEGGGIRRGLTVPEVAILFEKPFRQMVALTIIQLLKKKFIKFGNDSFSFIVSGPMKTISKSLNSNKRKVIRRDAAQKLEQIITPYEDILLEYFEQKESINIDEIDINVLEKPILEYCNWRMDGYDKNLSQEYYRNIITRSQIEVRAEGKLFLEKETVLEKNLFWILLKEENEAGREFKNYYPDWFTGKVSNKDILNIFEYYSKLK